MIAAEDILALAERLITGPAETEWRSAVSRAYYAAFHKARRLLLDSRFRVSRGDQAHAYLWMRLSNCGDPQLQLAGSDLSALRRDRNRADYDVDQTLAQGHCLLQVQTARQVIQLLNGAATEPTRTQIADAMKVYERDVLRTVTWQP